MVGAAKTTVGAQRRSLRTLRKDCHKRTADLRNLVKARKTAMDNIRADIINLEKEIKEANEELSVDFELVASSDSGSSSTDSSSKESAAKASKGKSQPSKKGAVAEGDNKQGQRCKRRPFLAPRAPAPNHRGWSNSKGEYYPGFVVDDPRHCPACEQLRCGFSSATKAHRPKDMPCPWAPLAKGS